MTILLKIAEQLEAEGIAVVGENLFVSHMASDVAGVLLFTDPEGFMQHTEVSDYYRGVYNVVVRHKSTTDGEAMCKQIFNVLRRQGWTLDEYRILSSKALMLPHSFGRNEAGFVEWILSFDMSFTVTVNE